MYPQRCSRCPAEYTIVPGEPSAFCPQCRLDIASESAAATVHRQKILAGDINEEPQNDTEQREVRRAIRKRLQASGSVPDCALPTRRTHHLNKQP